MYCSHCGARGPVILNIDRTVAVSDALCAWEAGPDPLRTDPLRRDTRWLWSVAIVSAAAVQVAQLKLWGVMWSATIEFLKWVAS